MARPYLRQPKSPRDLVSPGFFFARNSGLVDQLSKVTPQLLSAFSVGCTHSFKTEVEKLLFARRNRSRDSVLIEPADLVTSVALDLTSQLVVDGATAGLDLAPQRWMNEQDLRELLLEALRWLACGNFALEELLVEDHRVCTTELRDVIGRCWSIGFRWRHVAFQKSHVRSDNVHKEFSNRRLTRCAKSLYSRVYQLGKPASFRPLQNRNDYWISS